MQNDIVLDKYQIEGMLSENPIETHYLGTDIESGQKVLTVAINQEIVPSQEFLSRFELVAESLQGIDGPFAFQLLDFGEHIGQAVVIQEFIEGQTIAEMIVDSHGLPENLVLDIAQQVGGYLRDLHRVDLVHGSLGPDTILLSSKGTVQVRDAGLALGMNLNQLLAEGKIASSSFHAPELRSGGELNPSVDFYALGATLFELLTGEKLALEPADLWPGNKKQGLSPELDELVFKCLQTDPIRRIQSAAELLNGITEVRQGSQAGAQDTILGMEDALVGHTLGNYQLVERLGQGGMATVYKAYEPALDRYVAIKVLPQFFARDPSFMNRFRREAKAVAQLNHPSIMPIHSFGEEGNITYIAMQYVPGGTLKRGRGQVYEPAEAIRLALPIVRALAYAHGRGVVHRDIKPSNILISEDNWPVLADFGLAKMAEASQKLTGTGVGVGTPMYMSPEQGQGAGVDHRTDIYSMGIMLYEMLTGEVPFRADTPMAVVIKHMTAPLPMPRDINPDIPESIERIILKATAKSQDDRFQTAEEMIIALEQVQNSLLAPARDAPAGDAEVEPTLIRKSAAPVEDADDVTRIRKPAVPVQRGDTPITTRLKKVGIYLGAVVGVLLLGVALMWIFDICPPSGPWPIPPWCPGTEYELPTLGAADGLEENGLATDEPAATAVSEAPATISPASTISPTSTTDAPFDTVGKTINVTNAQDAGPGTLRQALLAAQAGDTIIFDPVAFPPENPVAIILESGLPVIFQGHITLDASNAGVILDGSQAGGEWTPGIEIDSEYNVVKGLQVVHFSGPGILLGFSAHFNVVGGDSSIGLGLLGEGNLISDNADGVAIQGGSDNVIAGNLIGTDMTGSGEMGNRAPGIFLEENASRNTIGPNNIIAFNGTVGGCGIEIRNLDANANTITANKIHDNENSMAPGICHQVDDADQTTYSSPPDIIYFDLDSGTVSGQTCMNCVVDIFSTDTQDGKIFEGRVTANEYGNFSFHSEKALSGPYLTATASSSRINTSEYSQPTPSISELQVALNVIKNSTPLHQASFASWDLEGDARRIENGKLIVTSENQEYVGANGHSLKSDRFAVEFEIRIVESSSEGHCVFGAINEHETNTTKRALSFGFWVNGVTKLSPYNNLVHQHVDSAQSTLDVSKSNTVMLIALGDKHAVFVNGQIAFAALDPFGSAIYQHYGLSANYTIVCEYDNYKFWDLTSLDFNP